MTRARSRGRWLRIALAVAIVGTYGVRAYYGVVGGMAYPRAKQLIDEGMYDEALPMLERADIGFNRSDVLWMKLAVRFSLARDRAVDEEDAGGRDQWLTAAARDYLEAAATIPVAAWPWSGLGEVYRQAETWEREVRQFDVSRIEAGPWGFLGRSGHIAIGMTLRAIEREPNDFVYHDQLAETYLEFGLNEQAMEAVRESARVQPMFHFHGFRFLRPLPEELVDAFAEGSREALGRTPMFPRRSHLVALARLETMRGRPGTAEADLREALSLPGDAGNRAEMHYLLGRALMAQEEFEEAATEFDLAVESPSFAAASLLALATIAEKTDRPEKALELLRRLRRLEPRVLEHCLRFARVARRLEEWPAAFEALKWARLVHPDDPRPRAALVEAQLAAGDRNAARLALQEMERDLGETEESRRLRDLLDGSAPAES